MQLMKFYGLREYLKTKIFNLYLIKIYCDNKAAISIAHNPILHDGNKHVEGILIRKNLKAD